jgi:hypothetical protein
MSIPGVITIRLDLCIPFLRPGVPSVRSVPLKEGDGTELIGAPVGSHGLIWTDLNRWTDSRGDVERSTLPVGSNRPVRRDHMVL